MVSYDNLLQQTNAAFDSGKTLDLAFRKNQLRALRRLYLEQEEEMLIALARDLQKPRHEAQLCEIIFLKNEVNDLLHNLEEYAAADTPSKPLANILDQLYIFKDPYGIVLIMSPWNYPLALSLIPLGGAIAAGNCAIIKPSELAPHTASFIAKYVPKYLDSECFHVVCGGVEETAALLQQKFDYIFYTGSTRVGQIIHQAANKHLTPCTLELGGKSPCFLGEDVNLERATKRILWGKFMNGGQTCIAPDYILCSNEVQKIFLEHAKNILTQWYGEYPKTTADLCRIINKSHFDRLTSYLKSGDVVIGGGFDPVELFIEPTVLVNVKLDDPIMNDEIFGPILPIVNVQDAIEAVKFIRSKPKPLALYVFSADSQVQKLFIKNVSAGGMCINETILHYSVDTLPFGGVGLSGFGSYHGKETFDSMCHRKACLKKRCDWLSEALGSFRYPPFSKIKTTLLLELLKHRDFPKFLKYLPYFVVFAMGNASCWFYYSYANHKNNVMSE
ncbi:aldehyde dehydrogenase family 3 member B1-like [Culicoides brevitarsis]|uniref:aldehyde dehydrogenase family 3 member B1-like n=1 Tax=Culicoides brevitarsis TaxID=469753 RepID=UPI00307B72E3